MRLDVADDVIEGEVRQRLRDHQGRPFCARCVARELPADAPLIRAALECPESISVDTSSPNEKKRASGLSFPE